MCLLEYKRTCTLYNALAEQAAYIRTNHETDKRISGYTSESRTGAISDNVFIFPI